MTINKRRAATNTGFASGGLTCKLGALCFYLSSVKADSFVLRNPPERKAENRCTSPYWDTAFLIDKTQNFAMLPHAIFSTLQGTQNPNTKPTLQRAKNANAQPAHPG